MGWSYLGPQNIYAEQAVQASGRPMWNVIWSEPCNGMAWTWWLTEIIR